MLSWGKVSMFVIALCLMTAMGIYIMSLQDTIRLLQQQNETDKALLELKTSILNRLEKNVKTLDLLSREREKELEQAKESLDKAKELLGAYENDGELPSDVRAILQSIGIVRQAGSEDGVCNGVQGDTGSGGMVTGNTCSDNDGNETKRLIEVDD